MKKTLLLLLLLPTVAFAAISNIQWTRNSTTASVYPNYLNDKIGIGTSSPVATLSVASSTATSTSLIFTVGTSTNALFSVQANGNVGIGTTTQTPTLYLFSGVTGINPVATFHGYNSTGVRMSLIASDRSSSIGLFSGGDLGVFGTNGLFISGNSPKILKALNGNQTTNYFQIDTDASNRTLFHAFNGGGTGAVGSTTLVFDTNGMTGLGTTSPSAMFFVQGVASTTMNPFVIASSSATNLFTINPNGNVGIATDTPGSLLSVQGNSYLAGTLTVTGTVSQPSSDLNLNGQGGNVNLQSFGGTSLRVRNTATTVLSGSFAISSTIAGSSGGVSIAGIAPILNATQTVPFFGIRYQPTISGFVNSSIHYGLYVDPSAINTGTVYSAILLGGNVGIGTTTPGAKLLVQGVSGSTSDIFSVATSTAASLFTIDSKGHTIYGGTAPTVGSCGSSPSIIGGNDNVMRVLAGGGVITACTVNFANSWTNPPVCDANVEGGLTVFTSASSTVSSVTITGASAITSDTLTIQCHGY